MSVEIDATSNHTEMQDKIANFLEGNKYNDGEEPELDDGGDIGLKTLDVPSFLEDNHLDCIILGCSDLKNGIETFESLTGLKCGIQTTLRGGAGTKSSMVKLDDSNRVFVEIMGPDPKNGGTDGTASELLNIPSGKLVPFGYSIRVDSTESLPNVPDTWQKDEIVMIGHGSPTEYDEDLDVYKWDLVHLYGHGIGGVAPSYVHWRENSGHPTSRLVEQGASLVSFDISAPSNHEVHGLVNMASGGIDISDGACSISVEISTPDKGTVKFTSTNPKGIIMPGFGDEQHESYNKTRR